jgi:hypothetical protein
MRSIASTASEIKYRSGTDVRLDKSRYVRWNNSTRVERFMVVSKSGFTRKAVDYARTHNFILLTPEEIWKLVA